LRLPFYFGDTYFGDTYFGDTILNRPVPMPAPRLGSHMARLARVAIPHAAHHITQRGNRRPPIFFSDQDRQNSRN